MKRNSLRWRTVFGQFIADHTVRRLVTELYDMGQPTSEAAVYKWVAGVRVPSTGRVELLIELSGGALSFGDVMRHRREVLTHGAGQGTATVAQRTAAGSRRN